MIYLFALFVIVPMVELALLIQIGRLLGTLPTLGLIVLTGALGAALARSQGLGVLASVRSEMAAGRVPAAAVADGVLILIAGAVLLTPGVITDVCGFLLLVPRVRTFIKAGLASFAKSRFERRGGTWVFDGSRRTPPDGPPTIDID